jgi:hypothetical protein
MTHRQYNRFRKWDGATQPAYNAGVMDGMDIFYRGEDRPPDPDLGYDAPFDLSFQWRKRGRIEQMLRNHEIARERGRVDGWDQAKEQQEKADRDDWIEGLVEDGLAKFEALLRAA